ncbi:MAG TPA: MlaD family protein [Bryobacteraceae bacterium]|nr:MlaD family protein [Bryobacteraceae bacterium]
MPTARQIRWAKFRVLVVAIVAATILTIVFYLLTGGTLLEAKATLYLYIPDATGVVPGSPVRVDGIGVGKVTKVKLSGSNQPARIVQVAMSVERNHLIHIPVDSTADVDTDTLLGDKFVAIQSGLSSSHVAPGAEIRLKPETNTLDLQQFAVALRTVDATLRDIENGTSPLGQFVIGDQMYRDLMRRVGQIHAGLLKIEDNTTQIGGLLYSDKSLRQIEAPLVTLDQTLARLQSGQGAMGAMLRDSAQYDSLRATFADLRKSVADFQASEWVQSDAMYEHWNRSLEALIQKVDEMNASPLFSSSSAYDNLNGFAREMETSMREFRENPKKFLRMKVF